MARVNDLSGTILSGGVAQVAVPYQGDGLEVTIQNRSVGSLFINTTGVATLTATGGSFEIKPLGVLAFTPNQGQGTPEISIIGATTGQEYTLKYEVFT